MQNRKAGKIHAKHLCGLLYVVSGCGYNVFTNNFAFIGFDTPLAGSSLLNREHLGLQIDFRA